MRKQEGALYGHLGIRDERGDGAGERRESTMLGRRRDTFLHERADCDEVVCIFTNYL
jgi:hypothetical protein